MLILYKKLHFAFHDTGVAHLQFAVNNNLSKLFPHFPVKILTSEWKKLS